ncbi:MAG TPA: phage baseplate assembly protein V [Thermoanaerobaculia bacterium]|jgi:phage baseplate assembly protein gpV
MKSLGALPQVRLTVDGAPLDAAASAALATVRVQQRLCLPALCELTFSGQTVLTGIAATPLSVGSTLELRVEDDELLFAGDITAVEYSSRVDTGRVIRVRAYDALHRLRRAQPVKAHTNITAAALARELVAPLNVDAAEEGRTIERWVQHRQNDLDFLTEVCARSGLYFVVDGDTLRLFRLQSSDAVELDLGETLLEARIDLTEPIVRSVSVRGWDPRRIATLDTLLEREEGMLERTLTDEIVADTTHAEEVAAAEMERRELALTPVWGVAIGDVRLRPGATVTITGVTPEASTAVITSVDHVLQRTTGFRSEFSNPLPQLHRSDRATVAALGIVNNVDDPDRLGRIKLLLPAYGSVETEWLPVASAGAGTSKGFIAIPNAGDHVLALFPRGEPAQGIVIGSLFRDVHPDPCVRRFTFMTPNGQRLQLDDERDAVRIENKTGSFVELTPELMHIHAATDLDIEAPGRTITIRGKKIDFKRA